MNAAISAVPTQADAYAEVPVSLIRRNPRIDPRKGRNADKYAAFVESIRTTGVMQPIIIRPVTDSDEHQYEVVAGNTRWQGSIDAGRELIPAMIREMTEDEAVTLAVVENVQRSDLTPIEEANAASLLLKQTGNDHAEVMRVLGWSATKLNSRILLTHASDAVAGALLQGHIKLGHAELLCPLEHDVQAAVVAKIVKEGVSVTDTKNRLLALTRNIGNAAFDTSGCVGCANNSSTYADLFDDTVGDGQCQNLTCWDQKVSAHLEGCIATAKEEFAVVYRSDELPEAGYTIIATDGSQGVGVEQASACRSCESYGAVVSAKHGKEGVTTGRHCFNLECHGKKVTDYKALVEAATSTGAKPEAHTPAAGSVTADDAKTIRKPAEQKSNPAPREMRKALKRVKHDTNVALTQKQIYANPNYALAQAIFTLSKHIVHGVKSDKLSALFAEFSIPERPIGEKDAAIWTAELGKQSHDLLTELLVRLAVLNAERAVTNDDFNRSEGAVYAETVVKHNDLRHEEAFEVNEAYLSILTKEELVTDCTASGFAAAYDKAHKEGAFKKLSNGKVKDLSKAMLALEGFSWEGYLPPLFKAKA